MVKIKGYLEDLWTSSLVGFSYFIGYIELFSFSDDLSNQTKEYKVLARLKELALVWL